jgi:hypothetical protein
MRRFFTASQHRGDRAAEPRAKRAQEVNPVASNPNPQAVQKAMSKLTPAERRAYMEAAGEQGGLDPRTGKCADRPSACSSRLAEAVRAAAAEQRRLAQAQAALAARDLPLSARHSLGTNGSSSASTGSEHCCTLRLARRHAARRSAVHGQVAAAGRVPVRPAAGAARADSARPRLIWHQGQADDPSPTRADLDVFAGVCARSIAAAGGTLPTSHVAYGYGLFTGVSGCTTEAASRATVVPASGGNTALQLQLLEDLGAVGLCCTPSFAAFAERGEGGLSTFATASSAPSRGRRRCATSSNPALGHRCLRHLRPL